MVSFFLIGLYIQITTMVIVQADSFNYSTISLGFFYPQTKLYGIPERETPLQLSRTLGKEPYEQMSSDIPFHMVNNTDPVYGTIPYILGVSANSTS